MNAQKSLETVIRRTTSRPFRFKFSGLYIGITGAVVYLNGMTSCSEHWPIDQTYSIGLILLVLLGLEWIEQTRFQDRPPIWIALLFLAARMAAIEGLVVLDCSIVSMFLYPMIAYSAYFTLGSRVSFSFSLFYIVLNLWRAGQIDDLWYLDAETTSTMLAFTFVMLFVPLVAYIIRKDDENRQQTELLLADLEDSHRKLQAYTDQVAELAAVEERNRLARDIHDSLGHYLTAVNIQLEKALLYQEHNPDEAMQAIHDAKQAAADALRDVRRSVSALRDSQGFSLHESLLKLIQNTNSDQLSVELTVDGEEDDYPYSTLLALYRAAQEGLTNIQKHAQASRVKLRLEFGEREARLILRDNGCGFDPQSIEEWNHQSSKNTPPGFGLRGLQERLELLHGSVDVQSDIHKGTNLTVVVPKPPSNPKRLITGVNG